MEKKFQVFISSTFKDLKEERQIVSNAILDMGHIPAGMEQFGALDEEQFEYIKRVIDVCDYYVLIMAGKYGSIDKKTNKSYTEMEFEYAKSKKIPVIALLFEDISQLKESQLEETRIKKTKLKEFRDKVCDGRLCAFWKDKTELDGKTVKGLSKAILNFPAVGWVRADKAENPALLQQIVELQKERDIYKNDIITIFSQINQNSKTINNIRHTQPTPLNLESTQQSEIKNDNKLEDLEGINALSSYTSAVLGMITSPFPLINIAKCVADQFKEK